MLRWLPFSNGEASLNPQPRGRGGGLPLRVLPLCWQRSTTSTNQTSIQVWRLSLSWCLSSVSLSGSDPEARHPAAMFTWVQGSISRCVYTHVCAPVLNMCYSGHVVPTKPRMCPLLLAGRCVAQAVPFAPTTGEATVAGLVGANTARMSCNFPGNRMPWGS